MRLNAFMLIVAMFVAAGHYGCRTDCKGSGVVWRTEEFATVMHPLSGGGNAVAIVSNGLFHVKDSGTQAGDMVAMSQQWRACPQAGAAVEARVKVVSCKGMAGVMLGFSDGAHEDILTLYTDKIELNHAKLAYSMDTTVDFHVYRVEIKSNDVCVAVDGVAVIEGTGVFKHPAHEGRNRVSYGAGSSGATGEAFWDWVRWTEAPAVLKAWERPVKGATHHVIYKEPGKYACFPSLLSDPETGNLYASFGIKGTATHFVTADTRSGRMMSADGGVTWSETKELPKSAVSDMPGPTFTAADGALVRIGQYWRRWYPMERLDEFKDRYDITYSSPARGRQANTFSTLSGSYTERSEDGGKTWKRQDIAGLDTYASGSSPWSMTQLPDGTVLRAFMVRKDDKCAGRVMVAITRDGRSAEVVDVMGDPENKLKFTEETLLHTTSKGVVWMLTRVHGGDAPIWQAVSRDGGKTWEARPTEIDARQTPPSGLVKLNDGRLVMVYGYRDAPSGIRALVSEDEGLTWRTDHVLVLRDDGDGFDLGYPRAVKLADETIVTVYYYATDDKVRHIACTRFKVPKLPARRGGD
ncbi:MAG: sialidase family protein [Kiritimatiellae bacterium]|nr:sialidase family protein [Kiritimatiellia bacterium]